MASFFADILPRFCIYDLIEHVANMHLLQTLACIFSLLTKLLVWIIKCILTLIWPVWLGSMCESGAGNHVSYVCCGLSRSRGGPWLEGSRRFSRNRKMRRRQQRRRNLRVLTRRVLQKLHWCTPAPSAGSVDNAMESYFVCICVINGLMIYVNGSEGTFTVIIAMQLTENWKISFCAFFVLVGAEKCIRRVTI